ncbi:histidine phosphatase family protein [Lujinxingia vulgaris]|uniref:Histidine phosphatase family protein n=1 Tax=Lujinxingia vulgaris TaxID=2600176 RepID=A0A5C6XBR4_9DELT|nr:histidine phosphatase family protein [Lujinxingia vulgaris]TXD36177.1 histidine phosphatase family protein [Lujinxingia vulgaris]
MQRRLIVMRHAKSDWAEPGLSDHRRPLNPRGRKDAPRVGQRLAELGWIPQVALSSDATRTRETFELMAPSFPDCELRLLSELYLPRTGDVLDALATLEDEVETALVLGHNPGFEQVLGYLAGSFHTLTTANAALLTASGDSWAEACQASTMRLLQIVRPKDLD